MRTLPSFDAPFTLGAQIEARARHPEVGSRIFLRQDDRAWTYRRYRDECGRLTLFGINTGLRGETLAGVLEQSRARVLVVDQRLQEEVERVRPALRTLAR